MGSIRQQLVLTTAVVAAAAVACVVAYLTFHPVLVVTGLVASGVGVIILLVIGMRITTRLRTIAAVATRVGAGEAARMTDRHDDEIGHVAVAFDAVLAQLRHTLTRLRHVARREQQHLERVVVARTAELDRRNAEMQLIFDHVDQGFMTIELDGTLARERSARVEDWLGPITQGTAFVDYMRSFAPEAADWFDMTWQSLVAGAMPLELCLAQLPSRFELGGRSFVMDYKPLPDAARRLRVLVVISDKTAEVARERAERDERETTKLLAQMFHDHAGFTAFCEEATRNTEVIADDTVDATTLRRAIHTLKGTCAMESITSLAELCDELETGLAENDETYALVLRHTIAARWKLVMSKVAPLLEARSGHVDLASGDLERLEAAVARGVPHRELAAMIATWHFDRIGPRLERFADLARTVASHLCKDPIEVRVDVDPDLRLPAQQWGPVWSTFVHVLRNAIDHGLETSTQRALAGKPAIGVIALRAHRRLGQIVLELEDSGRGIDWVRLAESARARGLPTATTEQLWDALFSDGVSTRTTVTTTSGRGVGLAAFRAACVALGGRISIASTANVGTRLTVTWPESAANRRTLAAGSAQVQLVERAPVAQLHGMGSH